MDFNRTVLVTGGSGFIGSHLVCSLVSRHPDWRIINLDNLDYCCSLRSLESVEDRSNYTFIRGDVCNSRLVKHVFNTENVDVVFHLAAKSHVESSFEAPSSFQRVNVDGTRVLLGAAHQARHRPQVFVYVSTDEVYGAGLDQVFDEDSPVRPSNPYAATKAAAEYLVRSYWDQYKFPVIITRSNNVYGPRQFTEKVIPRFLTLLQMNKKCTIQGTLPKSRHFLFVSDAVDAFLLVLEKGIVGEIYNVGSGCEIPIMQLARELVRMVKDVPDSEVNDWLEFVPDRPRVDLRYPITCEKSNVRRGSTCDTRSHVRSCSGSDGELRCPGPKESDKLSNGTKTTQTSGRTETSLTMFPTLKRPPLALRLTTKPPSVRLHRMIVGPAGLGRTLSGHFSVAFLTLSSVCPNKNWKNGGSSGGNKPKAASSSTAE